MNWIYFDQPDMSCIVYFVAAGDGPIKIGKTFDLEKRLWALQVGHYEELVTICTLLGGSSVEARLHMIFCNLRLRGEWFKPEHPLLEAIHVINSKTTDKEKIDAVCRAWRVFEKGGTAVLKALKGEFVE